MAGKGQRIDDLGSWRKPAVIAASVLFHAALLGLLAGNAPGVDVRFGPDAPRRLLIPAEMEPRPLLPGETARVPAVSRPANRPATQPTATEPANEARPALRAPTQDKDDEDAPSSGIAVAPSSPPQAPMPGDRWGVRPSSGEGRGFVPAGPLICRDLFALSPADRAVCEDRFGAAAARAAPIAGTGDAERDARFAAEGAFALAEYDRRRAPITPDSRARPCPHSTDIMGRCPVQVIVPLFSSQKGLLPGLKKAD